MHNLGSVIFKILRPITRSFKDFLSASYRIYPRSCYRNFTVFRLHTSSVTAGSADTVCPRPPLTVIFDRLTLKLVCESPVRWESFLTNFWLLGSRIIRYVRDGRTDRQTDGQKRRLLPPSYARGHNNYLLYNVQRCIYFLWWDTTYKVAGHASWWVLHIWYIKEETGRWPNFLFAAPNVTSQLSRAGVATIIVVYFVTYFFRRSLTQCFDFWMSWPIGLHV